MFSIYMLHSTVHRYPIQPTNQVQCNSVQPSNKAIQLGESGMPALGLGDTPQ